MVLTESGPSNANEPTVCAGDEVFDEDPEELCEESDKHWYDSSCNEKSRAGSSVPRLRVTFGKMASVGSGRRWVNIPGDSQGSVV